MQYPPIYESPHLAAVQEIKMNFNMELRYVLPPLISLLFMFLPSHVRPWNLDYDLLLLHSDPDIHPFLGMALLLLISILVFLFLSISTTLLLTVKLAANTIRLQAGVFSTPVAVSLLCSVFLPPPHFWMAYPVIICISPCFDAILNLLKRTLLGFCSMLQAIPPLNFVFSVHQELPADQEPPQVEVELVEIVAV